MFIIDKINILLFWLLLSYIYYIQQNFLLSFFFEKIFYFIFITFWNSWYLILYGLYSPLLEDIGGYFGIESPLLWDIGGCGGWEVDG